MEMQRFLEFVEVQRRTFMQLVILMGSFVFGILKRKK